MIFLGISASWAAFGCYLVYTIFVVLFLVWAGRVAFSGDVPSFKFKVDVEVGAGAGSAGVKAGAEASLNANSQIQSQMQNQYAQQRSFAATPINVSALRVP